MQPNKIADINTLKVKDYLYKYWQEKPLLLIMIASGFFRLLSVLFSKGYGMSDDHFLVIEAAQKWVNVDTNDWFPTATNNITKPLGHPLLYTGLHALLFKCLQAIGIFDPQIKMYIVRFIHAIYSLSIIYFGFKITKRLSGIQAAKTVGLLLGLLWFMPVMSVRNLVEFVCIPPLLFATWHFIKNENKFVWYIFLWIGFLLGIAFNIRFQTITFIGGFGLAILLLNKWKECIFIILGFLLCTFIVQAFTDLIIWKKPFMELTEYVRYNIENANNYITQGWYMYLLLIGGILIPPISIFIAFGFMRSWRKHLILFLPTFIFFVAHSIFPNKQERFILPAIPFIIILGIIGWFDYQNNSSFWKRNTKLLKVCWVFFWIINCIPLPFVSVAYTKRSRVEAMTYLHHQRDFKEFLLEESFNENTILPPLFYLGKMGFYYSVTKSNGIDVLINQVGKYTYNHHPNYIIFDQPDHLDERVNNMKKVFPNLTFETMIEPGFIDKILHNLNPHNVNYACYIYKTNEVEK